MKHGMWRLWLLCGALLCALGVWAQKAPVDPLGDVTQGALRVTQGDKVTECPLKHTDVQASVSGFIARVTVTQTFENPFTDKIEAVYVFPLPNTAAVDDMTMQIGDRKIVGVIKRRADARAIYEEAISRGQTAALLEQERPNIFTQSVGNIKPGQQVKIVISYVDVLKYDQGSYEFHFPMVVGPRYNPGGAPSANAPFNPTYDISKAAPPANRSNPGEVKNPPILLPGERSGHDISIGVEIDAGVPIQDLKVVTHKADVQLVGKAGASITLSPEDSIPNKDFIVTYKVIGDKPEMALMTHSRDSGDGYFLLMMQPKDIETALSAKKVSREIVFLIDVSGSMSGAPTEKNKQAMREFFARCKPGDTTQVVTFAGNSQQLFDKAVPVNDENIKKALDFTNGINGGGGTEMLKGINMVMDAPLDPERVRIVVLLTDGFIGNEAQIIEAVGKKAGDRIKFWTLGIGSSPNRFLLDGVAKQGGGGSAVIPLNVDPKDIVEDVMTRIHRAQLANIRIDWKGLPVCDIFPRKIPELWPGRPVIMYGRYTGGGMATVTISGTSEGEPVSYDLPVNLPYNDQPQHDVLSTVWARQQIEDLSEQCFYGDDPVIGEAITEIALKFRLMSQYTSFVAVDESQVIEEQPTPPRRVEIAVPLPEGCEYEGFFGATGDGQVQFDEKIVPMYDTATEASTYTINGAMISPLPSYGTVNGRVPVLSSVPNMGYMYNPTVNGMAMSTVSANPSISPSRASGTYTMRTGITNGTRTRLSPPNATYKSTGAPGAPGAPGNPGFTVTAGRPAPGGSGTGLSVDMDYNYHRKDAPANANDSTPARVKQAQQAYKEATLMLKKGNALGAMLRGQFAYLLTLGYQTDVSEQSLALIQQASGELNDKRIKGMPALKTKLDLVLRDESLADALAAVGKSAGITINIEPGSMEDAADMMGVRQARVSYLDLRHATLGQGLSWLLTPARLTWSAREQDAITVTSTRRLSVTSPWLYTVGALAQPTAKEAPDAKAKEKAYFDFLSAVLIVVGKEAAPGAQCFLSTNQFLLLGDANAHAKMAALIAALKDGKADMTKLAARPLLPKELATLAKLQTAAAARWKDRQQTLETAIDNRLSMQAQQSINAFSWPLLTEAMGGKVNLEALTELQVALKDPNVKVMLNMRDAWAITECSRRMPENAELKALATTALTRAAETCNIDPKTMMGNPSLRLEALYTVLAARKTLAPDDFRAKVAELETALKGSNLNDANGVLAASLLAPNADSDTALLKLLGDQQNNMDESNITLLAMAVRARGEDIRNAFRERQPELMTNVRNGNVILLINRLASAK